MSETNLALDALTALPKIIENGISFIREGKANKSKFFELYVLPIHEASQVLFNAHIVTLQNILEAAESKDQERAEKIIRNAVLFEQSNTDKLDFTIRIASNDRISGKLGSLFSFYILCVGKILVQPDEFTDGDRRNRVSIGVYNGLEDLIRLAMVTPERIKELIEFLIDWNFRVIGGFEELRIYCGK